MCRVNHFTAFSRLLSLAVLICFRPPTDETVVFVVHVVVQAKYNKLILGLSSVRHQLFLHALLLAHTCHRLTLPATF